MKRLFFVLLLVLWAFGLSSLLVPAHAQYIIDYVIRPYKPDILDSWFFGINNQGQTTGMCQPAMLKAPTDRMS